MNPAQRTAIWEHIFHDRGERGEFFPISRDQNFRRNPACQLKRVIKQREALEFNEALISPHARALSARQDERCYILHVVIIHTTGFADRSPTPGRKWSNRNYSKPRAVMVLSKQAELNCTKVIYFNSNA
jgi:hypothetical protein